MTPAPGSWETVPLGQVCKIDKKQDDHTDLPYVGMEHIEAQTSRFIGSLQPQTVKSKTFRFTPNHVLYGRLRPYLNKVILPEFTGHCATEIFPLLPKPVISREFLRYWLMQDETVAKINATCTGARMPRANMKEVMGFKIPLPPLSEQRRIVSVLDAAFAGLATATANTQKNLTHACELFESEINVVFERMGKGWEAGALEDFVESVSTGPFGSLLHKADYSHGGTPLVNPINIVEGKIISDERKAVDENTRKRLSAYSLSAGDVVIGRRGEIGRCAVVTKDQDGWLCGTGCFVIRTGTQIEPNFLCHLLRSERYRSILEGESDRATMPSISNKQLAKLVINLPSHSEQLKLNERFDELAISVGQLDDSFRRKLAALEELKQSLLHRAFRGELTGDGVAIRDECEEAA